MSKTYLFFKFIQSKDYTESMGHSDIGIYKNKSIYYYPL